MPTCVCPVCTADKNNGKARFVHNSRRINKKVKRERVQCVLESLLKTRNMYVKGGFLVGTDYSSGYHCLYLSKHHRKYLAFAMHVSELTDEALTFLWENHNEAFCQVNKCFIFEYVALPFGLSSSCRAFNDLISGLVGFWRRLPLPDGPVRASSYIEDINAVTTSRLTQQ